MELDYIPYDFPVGARVCHGIDFEIGVVIARPEKIVIAQFPSGTARFDAVTGEAIDDRKRWMRLRGIDYV